MTGQHVPPHQDNPMNQGDIKQEW